MSLPEGYFDAAAYGFTTDPDPAGFFTSDGTWTADGDGVYVLASPNLFALRVAAGAGPAFGDRAGELLGPLLRALTAPIAVTDRALRPTDRGWPGMFDLDTSPDPALIGRATGTPVPANLTQAQRRAYVRDRPSWRRGTPRALVAAVQSVLTGARQVRLVERDGSPWRLTVRVYRAQYAGTLDQLRQVVATQKPVGIVVSVVIDAGASYEHMRTQHGPTYTANTAAFPTYADATAHEPEGGTT